MTRRALACILALGLLLLSFPAPAMADPEEDHTRVIKVRSASWDAGTGTVRATVGWNREEWKHPNVNDLDLVVLARTGEAWTRLRSRPVKASPKKKKVSYTLRVPERNRDTANAADQILVAATQRHADKPGTFEIAWYSSRTIAGKPEPTARRTGTVSCAAIFPNAYIEECGFFGIELTSVDLRGADLNDTQFDAADFTGANLARAFIARTHLGGATLKDADLRHAVLVRSHLPGADASGANLSGADLTETNLANIRLSGAKLTKALVANANLNGANLTGAVLSGTDFSFSNLTDATLRDATVSSSTSFFEVTYCRTVMPDGTVNNANC